MSLTDKRKTSSTAAGSSSSYAAASSSKRVRLDEPPRRQRRRPDTDFFDGDPEIEEEDRRRIRKHQKSGRIDDRGEDLSESDDSDGNGADIFNGGEDDSDAEADVGSHRRRAQKKRRADATGAAGDDDDEDMFDIGDDHNTATASKSSNGKQRGAASDKHLKSGELGQGQDFGSKNRSALDAADDDAELLGGGDQDDEDLDPDLELEDEDEEEDNQDVDDRDDPDRHRFVDLNAYAERSPPTSPGGTPLPLVSRKSKSRKIKPKAPKVTGFNMKQEMRTGKFDADGNYHENQRDPHAQHDAWLAGNYSKSKILEARQAQQKRDQEARDREQTAQKADGDEDEVKKRLVEHMHRSETVQRALQRLGQVLKEHKKAAKANGADREERQQPGDAEIKQAATDVETVTHLSSVLMSRFGRLDIYDQTYEQLLKDVHKSGLVRRTFDPAAKFDPPPLSPTSSSADPPSKAGDEAAGEWEYRWTPSYLAAAAREAGTPVDPEIQTFGPFGLADLTTWAEQGYFGDSGERILLRPSGSKDPWMAYNHVVASISK